jgi:DnaJ-class molecular chaperone
LDGRRGGAYSRRRIVRLFHRSGVQVTQRKSDTTKLRACHACDGTGHWHDNSDGQCNDCHGKGWISESDARRLIAEDAAWIAEFEKDMQNV